jgi:NADH-quinone oxidoreductase subunit H
MLDGPFGLKVVLIVILKTLVTFGILLVSVMLMIWFERKLIGDMQNRIGPNRAGPFGMLQTLADGIKLFFKEDLIPDRANGRVHPGPVPVAWSRRSCCSP